MKNSEVIENKLGIKLPHKYATLINDPVKFDDKYAFEYFFEIETESLISENEGYIMDPDNISNIDDGTFLGGIKRFFIHGSKKKLIATRHKWIKDWIEPKRFIIGSDGGESVFFIHLNDDNCSVYTFDLETQKSDKEFDSLDLYITYVNEACAEDT
mgnify:CR=1 FL=1